VIDAAVRNIRDYKTYRHLLSQHSYHLTPIGQARAWQGMQFAARNRRESVVFLFRNDSDETKRRFALHGLDPHARYAVTRLNDGTKQAQDGSHLMARGVEVTLARDPQESEVLVLAA
jgi:hypothetical protein